MSGSHGSRSESEARHVLCSYQLRSCPHRFQHWNISHRQRLEAIDVLARHDEQVELGLGVLVVNHHKVVVVVVHRVGMAFGIDDIRRESVGPATGRWLACSRLWFDCLGGWCVAGAAAAAAASTVVVGVAALGRPLGATAFHQHRKHVRLAHRRRRRLFDRAAGIKGRQRWQAFRQSQPIAALVSSEQMRNTSTVHRTLSCSRSTETTRRTFARAPAWLYPNCKRQTVVSGTGTTYRLQHSYLVAACAALKFGPSTWITHRTCSSTSSGDTGGRSTG